MSKTLNYIIFLIISFLCLSILSPFDFADAQQALRVTSEAKHPLRHKATRIVTTDPGSCFAGTSVDDALEELCTQSAASNSVIESVGNDFFLRLDTTNDPLTADLDINGDLDVPSDFDIDFDSAASVTFDINLNASSDAAVSFNNGIAATEDLIINLDANISEVLATEDLELEGTNAVNIKSGNSEHILLQSAGNVGITGAIPSTPTSKLYVDDSLGFEGIRTVTTTSATLDATDNIVIVDDDTAGSLVTINLPNISGITGRTYYIKKIGTTADVRITPAGVQRIDNVPFIDLTDQHQSVRILTDSLMWRVISNKISSISVADEVLAQITYNAILDPVTDSGLDFTTFTNDWTSAIVGDFFTIDHSGALDGNDSIVTLNANSTSSTGSDNYILTIDSDDGDVGGIDVSDADTNDAINLGGNVINGTELKIDGDGNIGVGTVTPGTRLDLVTEAGPSLMTNTAYSDAAAFDAPTIRLQRAGGTASSTTAIGDTESVGHLAFLPHNGTGFIRTARVSALATENHSLGNQGTKMEFTTTPNSSDSEAIRVTIAQDGNVGVGVTAPSSELEVVGDITLGADGKKLQDDDQDTYIILEESGSLTCGTEDAIEFRVESGGSSACIDATGEFRADSMTIGFDDNSLAESLTFDLGAPSSNMDIVAQTGQSMFFRDLADLDILFQIEPDKVTLGNDAVDSQDQELVFDGDTGTDGTIIWDISEDRFTVSGTIIPDTDSSHGLGVDTNVWTSVFTDNIWAGDSGSDNLTINSNAVNAASWDYNNVGRIDIEGLIDFTEPTDVSGLTDNPVFSLINYNQVLDADSEAVIIPTGFTFGPTIDFDTAQSLSTSTAFNAAPRWRDGGAGAHTIFVVGGMSSNPILENNHAGTHSSPTEMASYTADPKAFESAGTMTVDQISGYLTNIDNPVRAFFGLQQIQGADVTHYGHFVGKSGGNLLITLSGSITNEYGLRLVGAPNGTNAYSLYVDEADWEMYHEGNVGLGISAPASLLDVEGDFRISKVDAAQDNDFVFDKRAAALTVQSQGVGNKNSTEWYTANGGADVEHILYTDATPSDISNQESLVLVKTSGIAQIYTDASGTGTVESLRLHTGSGTTNQLVLSSNENVGISQASPAEKLDVVGSVLVSDDYLITDGNYVGFDGNGNARFIWTDDATDHIALDDGNLSLSDTALTPTDRLHLNGNIQIDGHGAGNIDPFIGGIKYDNTFDSAGDASPNKLNFFSSGSFEGGIGVSTGDVDYFSGGNHKFYTDSTNVTEGTLAITIEDATGHLGVGLSTPGASIHVGTGGSVDNVGDDDVYIQNDLEVDGTIFTNAWSSTGETFFNGAMNIAVDEINSNTTLDNTYNVVLCETSGGNVTITLPASAAIEGRVYTVKKLVAANTCTIDGNASETIDGALTLALEDQYDSVKIVAYGTEWHSIGVY